MNTPESVSTDYARALALDSDRLHAEISRLQQAERATADGPAPASMARGVSVVVASYRGVGRISAMLDSLEAQTLPYSKFEVVIVLNGPDDGTAGLLRERAAGTDMHLRVLMTAQADVGAARNVGIDAARMSHVTFLDDDDLLEPQFLASVMAAASRAPSAVVVSPIVNVDGSGAVDDDNPLNRRITGLAALGSASLAAHPWLLGFNACKTFPTAVARQFRYATGMRSGEDVVYFAHLLTVRNLGLVVADARPSNAYRRTVRGESVSRREGFDFMVTERLAVIRRLDALARAHPECAGPIRQLIAAQQGFIERYAAGSEGGRDAIFETVAPVERHFLPWSALNKGSARSLAISYCFMPFSDTSGVVAAKAIVERDRIVDVISNDMKGVRRTDASLSAIAGPWIDQHFLIDTKPSFAGWAQISEFATKALAVAERQDALKGGYESVYSRALWVGSHVAAALFKLRHWGVTWTAEFSDPLRRGAAGEVRPGALTDNDVAARLRSGLASRGFDSLPVETLFDLVEAATMVLADEVIFTNANQMEYMLSLYDSDKLTSLVRSKAVVRPHPVPQRWLYDMAELQYPLPEGVVNFAYFGSFYPNRGIGTVLQAILNLPVDVRRRVRVHVFCNAPRDVKDAVADLGLSTNVYVNPYLDYFAFLRATREFDVLIVNDVIRDEQLPINPFLPSKLSDYLGSGRDVWALWDEGSPLSTHPDVRYRSPEGNVPEIIRGFISIVDDKGATR